MEFHQRRQLIEYARYHGLFTRGREENILEAAIHACPPLDDGSGFEDPDGVATVNDLAIVEPKEKLELSKGAALLLRDVLAANRSTPPPDDFDDTRHRIKRLKLDLPLLRTDHELDVKAFQQLARDRERPEAYESTLYHVNEEADEGLQWPSHLLLLPEQQAQRLNSERLEISRDAVELLACTRSTNLDSSVLDQSLAEDLCYKRKASSSALMTPPLMPASPHPVLEPSSPITAYAEPIEYTSPLANELRRLQADVMGDERLDAGGANNDDQSPVSDQEMISEVFFDDTEKVTESLPSTPKRTKPWDLKMEVPLTPGMPKLSKAVSFSDTVEEMEPFINAAKQDAANADQAIEDEELDTLFKEMIEPAALKAQYEVEHEQLHAADSIQRMTVPPMDMSVTAPPWKEPPTQETEQQDTKDVMLAFSKMKLHHWPGIGKLELNMPWAPFRPELAQVALKESIGDSTSSTSFLEVEGYGEALSMDSLTWKPDGLRALDVAESDDEDLIKAPIEDRHDVRQPLGKRGTDSQDNLSQARQSASQGKATISRVEDCAPTSQTHNTNEATFSTSEELDRFMAMQGRIPKKQKSHTQAQPPEQCAIAIADIIDRPVSGEHAMSEHGSMQSTANLPSLFPIDPNALASREVLLSSKFLARRNLCRSVSAIWPSLSLIERDWALPETADHKHTQHSMDEGDIVVSSSTTIVCTTPASMNQKPLPGQGKESALKARLRVIASRFERVIVVVGARQGGEISALQGSDIDAFNDFVAFCATLLGDVTVFYASGDETNLARWLVGIIDADKNVEHSHLLQDPTYWEVLLRRAGLNAFAAQAIIGALKPSDGHGGEGLAGFVAMPHEERVDSFSELLGGQMVLERVSRVLDGNWAIQQEPRRVQQ